MSKRQGALTALVLGLGLMFQGNTIAQTLDSVSPETLKNMSLEELMNIEVTSASRHPQPLSEAAAAIEVITGEDIRRSGATSLPEALRLASNLDVAQKNSHDWAITARGFNTALANKLLVMIDGRAVYTPLFSGVFWDVQNVLLEDVERIEVISGPGGTLWGANAVNGVINIITKSARDTQGGYVEAAGGSQLRDSGGVRYGGMLAPDVYARVYGQAFNRRDESLGDGSPAGDAWRQSQAGFRIDAGASPRNQLSLHGDVYDGDEHVVTGGVAAVSGANLVGRWSRTTADRSDMSVQVYFDHTHLEDPIPAFVVGQSLELSSAGILTDDLDTFDVDFQYRLHLGERSRLVWGAGYRHTSDEVDNAPSLAFFPSRLQQDLFSAFAQDEVTLADNLEFTFGSKLEHNDYTGFEVEPGVRLQWNPLADQSVWTALSRAVRTPSRIDRDLSEPAPSAPLVILAGSSDFTSESVIAREIGYRAKLGPDVAIGVSVFSNAYHDLRSASANPGTTLPIYFHNDVEGETHGVEASVDYHVTQAWRLRASYDPLRENLRVKPGQHDINDALNEVADPSTRWSLRSSMDLAHDVDLDMSLRRIGERGINRGATIGIVPAYTEMDVRVAWHPAEKIELSLVGQNLLHDRHAEYGYPGPDQVQIDRSVYGKIAWHF